jgi:hypothetical protein
MRVSSLRYAVDIRRAAASTHPARSRKAVFLLVPRAIPMSEKVLHPVPSCETYVPWTTLPHVKTRALREHRAFVAHRTQTPSHFCSSRAHARWARGRIFELDRTLTERTAPPKFVGAWEGAPRSEMNGRVGRRRFAVTTPKRFAQRGRSPGQAQCVGREPGRRFE